MPGPGRLRDALLIFATWTAVGLFYTSQNLAQMKLGNDPTPAWHPLVAWMVGVWIGAALTPVVLWLGRRFPFSRRRWLAPAFAHAAFSFGYGTVQIVVQAAILPQLHVYPKVMPNATAAFVLLAVIGFHQSVLTYWTLLALQAGRDYYRRFLERRDEAARLELRAAELHSRLAQAQLGALKAQLQPHFLFNTLNAIMSLVRQEKGAEAEIMLGRLADLLRCVLDDIHAHEVPLSRELEYLRLYLSIEEVRFEDRLRVEIAAEAGLLDALVPHLCLQPVVENAIRHGLGRSAAASRITIRARRDGGTLVLTVEDDGPGLAASAAAASPAKPPGIGLANTRARLAQLYGEAASLTIEDVTPHGVRATVRLPYREPDETPHEEAIAHAVHRADRG